MKNLQTFNEFLNEATSSNEAYAFFYLTTNSLINVDTDKIFKGWKSAPVEENLSTDWIVYVKKIKSADLAKDIVDAVWKRFPRKNSIVWQAGLYFNGEFTRIEGTFNSYVERWFAKTIKDLSGN